MNVQNGNQIGTSFSEAFQISLPKSSTEMYFLNNVARKPKITPWSMSWKLDVVLAHIKYINSILHFHQSSQVIVWIIDNILKAILII